MDGSSKHRKGAVSKSRVLDVAAGIFAAQGYAGTTMRAVGKAAGLEAGSVYYHFDSKEALARGVLEFAMTEAAAAVRHKVEALPAEAGSAEIIEAAVRGHLHSTVRLGDYTLASRRIAGQVPDGLRQELQGQRNAYGDYWRTLFQRCKANGDLAADTDPGLARLYLLGALNWVAEWFHEGGKSIDQIAQEFTRYFLSGVGGPR